MGPHEYLHAPLATHTWALLLDRYMEPPDLPVQIQNDPVRGRVTGEDSLGDGEEALKRESVAPYANCVKVSVVFQDSAAEALTS